VAHELDDDRLLARAYGNLGWIAVQQGDAEAASPALDESLTRFRRLGDLQGVAWLLQYRGDLARRAGDLDRARALIEESFDLRIELADTYGLSATLPTHPFCTDSDVPFSPLCQRNDWGADPLFDNKAPVYNLLVSLILDGVVPADDPDYGWWTDWYLNGVLAFARDPGTVDPAERTAAVTIAFDRMGAPMSAADLASPAVVARANVLAEQVLRRIALDDPSLRGDMNIDVSDPDVVALVAAQAGRMLRNEDGVRPPPLRRTAVDVLAKLQSDSALLELAASRDAIQAALAGGQIPTAERPFIEDILARAERALTPYFN